MNRPQPVTLLILILVLLTSATSLSMAQAKPLESGSGTGSKPSQTAIPDWKTILPLDPQTAKIIGEEIEASLKSSWEDGFKTARIEYEPQAEYWMAIAMAPLPPDRFWDGVTWGSLAGGFTGIAVGAGLVLAVLQVVR